MLNYKYILKLYVIILILTINILSFYSGLDCNLLPAKSVN